MALADTEGGRSALGRSLLAREVLTADWVPAFETVPRAAFLPDRMWPYDMATGRTVTVDRRTDPEAWHRYADEDGPIVTQWDDGATGDGPGIVSTSSASMPSVVFGMLRDLDVHAGQKVLEIGTGTGWNAALLAHRLGHHQVVTVEIDSSVAAAARVRLSAFGLPVRVLDRDGVLGDQPDAPYDRIIATAGLRRIPSAWLEQVQPGGLILAPWGTHYSNQDALARLTFDAGAAVGHFTRPVQFMKLRAQRLPSVVHGEYVPAGVAGADRSTTSVTAAQLFGDGGRFDPVTFAVGLRVRDCRQNVVAKRDGARPVWLYGLSDRSWACVMFRDGQAHADVWQSGPRRLWDEAQAALTWWREAGQPGYDRFGLTVTRNGTRAWLDDPSTSWEV